MAATDDNAGTSVPATADTPAPAAPKKRAPRAAKPDPEALAAEIEKTREDLADTLDAIAEKVSPKRVAKRTTKKVTSAVKDTASSAKDKVSGGRSEQSWAPPAPKARPAAGPEPVVPGPVVEEPTQDLPSAEPAPVPADLVSATTTAEPAKPWYAPAATPAVPPPASPGPLVRPEYIAVGAAAALVAWFLVRRRR